MNKFSHGFYRFINKKKESEFEPIFKEFKDQINIYQRQLDLTLKSYVDEWNEEINKNDENYKALMDGAEKIYNDIIKGSDSDENSHSYASHAAGFDSIEYEHSTVKEDIDKEYIGFLDLYSKSVLIALYSLNESKLNQIIESSSVIFDKKIKPSHLDSRDYLNSSIIYLNLVLDIETKTIESYLTKLKDIQFLRNSIIHNNSIFIEKEKVTYIIDKHKGELKLDDNGFLMIIRGSFIREFFLILKSFYEELFWLIDIKQELKTIKNGLVFWLGIIDKKIQIEKLNLEKKTDKEKKYILKLSSKIRVLKILNAK
ncbi:hypothetical protein U8527_14780 [Kordia algicida OT-1]|uniref:Uncharacterized protein n=1 Tax=Kordia algicida OT-1 TaxID=391587 RepID=A9DYS9_9FLAO|nr:hypothetical protein [Kordia algicida]EDP96174.1 hypothetical protein KAOT1_08393 [Kordia algicida OT-1]